MKILHLSDSAAYTTGYASQTRLLGNTLANAGHEFYQLGHNYHGQIIKNATLEDGEKINFPLLPNDGSEYAVNSLPEYFTKYKPDVFSILLDTFMLQKVQMPFWSVPAKSLFWYPSDGAWFPRFCENVLAKVDYPVAMAKYGQDQAKRLFGIKAEHIPHGVKSDIYRPYTEEEKNATRLEFGNGKVFAFKDNRFFPLFLDLRDKFIVGCVARNQGRKNLPELMKAFCVFAKDKEDVRLLMHSDPVDPAMVCDLQEIAERYGEGHKVLWTGMRISNPFPTSRMVQLYNVMDVFALFTTGEGFGVPYIEAMACRVPVIATDCTTTKEIITDNDAGLGVKLMGEEKRPYPGEKIYNGTIVGTWGVERSFADHYDSVEQLNYAYNNRDKMKVKGKNGRKAVMEHYDWDGVVGPKWVEFMKQVKQG